jgi:hypothetical protein
MSVKAILAGAVVLALCRPALAGDGLRFLGGRPSNPSILYSDMGTIDSISLPTLTQSFRIKNDGSTAIRITKIDASCGCTSLLWNGAPLAEGASPELAAGAYADLGATHDLYLLHPGAQTKYLWVYAGDDSNPAATVEIKLNVKAAVRFIPEKLALDPRKPATAPNLIVEMDPRLMDYARKHGFPKLKSSDPNIAISAPVVLPKKANRERSAYRLTVRKGAVPKPTDIRIGYPPTTGSGPEVDPRGIIFVQAWAAVRIELSTSKAPTRRSRK